MKDCRCEHCGAIPTGTLFGLPVIVHAAGCPKLPPLRLIVECPKRFLCLGCGVQYDSPGEAEHAAECPAKALMN